MTLNCGVTAVKVSPIPWGAMTRWDTLQGHLEGEKRAGPVDPCVHQSLDVGCPGKGKDPRAGISLWPRVYTSVYWFSNVKLVILKH